jgi:hypothetical protein
MTEAELYTAYYDARDALAGHEGVVGVSLGLRERAGELTDETVLRVYVKYKLPLDELVPGAPLPASHAGLPIDVHEVTPLPPPSYAHEDKAHHPAVIGGIGVGTGRTNPAGNFGFGTIGFLATIDGLAPPHNVALVTNRHVLAHHGGHTGDEVFQPDQTAGLPNNPIAQVLAMPEIEDHTYTYPVALQTVPSEPASPFWVDCASAQLKISVSSWCGCKCGGVSFASRINALALANPIGDAVVDVARAQLGETVFKVGWRTGRTQGVVSALTRHVEGGGLQANGILEVTFVSATHPDVSKFSDEGDSGAAIVNQQGKLVGLLYSADLVPNKSLCSHIHPVLDVLHVTPITRAHPVSNPAQTTAAELSAMIGGPPDQTTALRERLLAGDEGMRIAALVERHRHEVMHLVNHCRRVTIAWHRNKGPAYTNRAIANARDPEVPIPREIEGVTPDQLLRAMHAVLAANGSLELREALDAHADEMIERARSLDSLHDAVDALEAIA